MHAFHAVLLTIHTLIVLALVGVVLLQRSEGGALGMGGGGGGGGLMSGRGAANVLTRSTTMLGAAFFATSLILAITSDRGETEQQLLERTTGETSSPSSDDPSVIDVDDILNRGGSDEPEAATGDEADPLAIPDPAAGVIPDPSSEPVDQGTGDEGGEEEEPQR